MNVYGTTTLQHTTRWVITVILVGTWVLVVEYWITSKLLYFIRVLWSNILFKENWKKSLIPGKRVNCVMLVMLIVVTTFLPKSNSVRPNTYVIVTDGYINERGKWEYEKAKKDGTKIGECLWVYGDWRTELLPSVVMTKERRSMEQTNELWLLSRVNVTPRVSERRLHGVSDEKGRYRTQFSLSCLVVKCCCCDGLFIVMDSLVLGCYQLDITTSQSLACWFVCDRRVVWSLALSGREFLFRMHFYLFRWRRTIRIHAWGYIYEIILLHQWIPLENVCLHHHVLLALEIICFIATPNTDYIS